MPDYRILVTGSRTWGDPDRIGTVLSGFHAHARNGSIVLVHGQCDPRVRTGRNFPIPWAEAERMPAEEQMVLLGADWLADRLAARLGWKIEPHPAGWQFHGKRAGFIRNAEMVSLGADAVSAFILPCTDPRCRRKEPHGSHGATHCAGLAEKAGIPVRRVTAPGAAGPTLPQPGTPAR